jgi:hypothetical protein
MSQFQVNQIVAGKSAGNFKILGFRTVGQVDGVQVKPVNPNNHAQVGKGEMFFPLDAIKPL